MNKRTHHTRKSSVQHGLASVILAAGLGLGAIGNANAHCSWEHIHHCFVDAGTEIKNTTEETADDLKDTTTETYKDAANFTQTTVDTTVNSIEEGIQAAADAIDGIMVSLYENDALQAYTQFGKPMEDMASAWKTLLNSEPAKFNRLADAIRTNDGPELKAALNDAVLSLLTYAGFGEIVKSFQDKKVGSILFIVSAGGGTGVTVEGDVGIAIDLEYLIHGANRIAKGYTTLDYNGPVASIFTAGGVQIGPAAGGGVDFVIGYHLSKPNGVYGPGLDISLELKATVGGSIGFGYDLTKAPWQVVMGGIGVGGGLEVKLAAGPSYTVVLGTLCSNGKIKFLAAECPALSDISAIKNYVNSNHYLHIENGSLESGTINVKSAANIKYYAHMWNVSVVPGTKQVMIQNVYMPFLFLSTASGTLQVTAYSDSALWELTRVSSNARTYLIRNVKTGEYLYSVNGALNSSLTVAASAYAYWKFDKYFSLSY